LTFDTLLRAWGTEIHPGTRVIWRSMQYLWLKLHVGKNFTAGNFTRDIYRTQPHPNIEVDI
jgi:hypothetical protein